MWECEWDGLEQIFHLSSISALTSEYLYASFATTETNSCNSYVVM